MPPQYISGPLFPCVQLCRHLWYHQTTWRWPHCVQSLHPSHEYQPRVQFYLHHLMEKRGKKCPACIFTGPIYRNSPDTAMFTEIQFKDFFFLIKGKIRKKLVSSPTIHHREVGTEPKVNSWGKWNSDREVAIKKDFCGALSQARFTCWTEAHRSASLTAYCCLKQCPPVKCSSYTCKKEITHTQNIIQQLIQLPHSTHDSPWSAEGTRELSHLFNLGN